MMYESGKSDRPIGPKKPPNKAVGPAAEAVEGRGLAEGNLRQQNRLRTQGREGLQSALEWIRGAAKRDRKMRFTALLHHIYDIGGLRAAFYALKREAAAGIDGETWKHYRGALEENLCALSERLKRGAYRAKPARRAYISKEDGRQRPLGVPVLEDKVVERATVEVLNAIYEVDFLGFSYGYRTGRSAHQALDALATALMTRRVNWVLDCDLRSFFDTLVHSWLVQFIEHRIADRRVVRLIQKWLSAGVLEDGKRAWSEQGTVQGGSISPLLANVYLHYVLDLWVRWWRKKRAQGDVVYVRFADDFVLGFEHREEAERFRSELIERLLKFGLELNLEKTRLIEFGRYAAKNRQQRGEGKPETFNFLGFTHMCAKTRRGRFTVIRQTMRKRMQAKLNEIAAELRQRLHDPVPEVGDWLRSVVRGHLQYYGVPMNWEALYTFRRRIGWLWQRMLRRRSHKSRLTKERFERLQKRWLPTVRLYHPYPLVRLGVIT